MTITRRQFVRSAGLATLFSPFISLLDPSRARAQAAPGRAKYLLIFHTTGTNIARWTPSGSTSTQIRFSEMTSPLSAIASDIVILEGLDSMGTATQHGQTGGLSGRGYVNEHITLDQFVADELRTMGVNTPIPVINLGGNPGEAPSTFKKGSNAITPIFEPQAALDAIFNGTGAPSGGDTASAAALIRRKRSMLDVVKGELTQLGSALGAEEKQRLALHEESIRNLERRLESQLEEANRPPEARTCQPPAGVTNMLPGIKKTALNLDMAVTALGCDLTRVAAVEFGHHQSFQVELDDPAIRADWHNGLIHGEGGNGKLIDLEKWLCSRFVDAVQKMKQLPAPDGSGTLFDQTLIIWTRGMGDSLAHAGNDMRFVLSGGAGGYLKKSPNGRYIRANGEPHQTVLTACAHALGISDFSRFGNQEHSKTPFGPLSA